MDRTSSPWRALDDPGGPGLPPESPSPAWRRPARQWLLVGLLGLGVGLAGVVLLVGPAGPATVSVASAGGDSPAFSPGDGGGTSLAGGDGTGASGQQPDPSSGPDQGSSSASAGASDGPAGQGEVVQGEVVVEVAGAVLRPGVYHLAAGARVADAIAAAGGYGPRIDLNRATAELNLAARVADGDRIIVPSRDDPAGAGSSGPSTSPPPTAAARTPAGPVDLNKATADELDALPGVGPVTVAKIIASRTAHAFHSIDDLLNRKLVGQAEFAKIRKLVTVG